MKPVYQKYVKTVTTVWLVSFVVLAGAYMFLLAPQSSIRRQLDQQLAQKKRACGQAQLAADQEYRNKQQEEIERLASKLRDYVVGSDESDSMTFNISQIARKTSIDAPNIKNEQKSNRGPSDSFECEFITENYISVDFAGDFDQFAKLLNALERHRPAIFVEAFSIERSKRDGALPDVDMRLAFFARKQAEDSTASL